MKNLFKLVFFLIAYSLIINGSSQNHNDESQIHIKPIKPINFDPRARVGHNAPPDRNPNGGDDKLRNHFPYMSGYDDSLILRRRPKSSESLSVHDLLRLRPSTTQPPLSTVSLNSVQWHSKLEDFFRTTIQSEYVPFFEWMWKALDNGTLDKNHYYPAMFKDKKFKAPLNPQITADLPFPNGWGQMYLYLKELEHYRKHPTTEKPTTLPADPEKRRAVSFFRRTFPAHYDNYYKWLYENVHDYSGARKRVDFCDQKGLTDFDFSMLLKSTPFRIPPRHRRFFVMINDVERRISSTAHHYWRSTTPDLYHINQQMDKSYLGDHVRTSRKREDFWEDRYQRYYPFTPEPQYEQFYRWFFKENHELNMPDRFGGVPFPKIIPFAVNPRIHDVTYKNTPYKIPPLYTVLFAFLDDAKLDNMTTRLSTWPTFNWEDLTEITGRTTTRLPSTPPTYTEYPLYTIARERKRKIAEFFNVTIDPWYEPFYEWFYRYQNDRKGIKRRLPAYLNLTDFDYSHELSKAKYPVPDKHRDIWAYVHAVERQILSSTGHHYQPKNPYQWTYRYITEPKIIKDLEYWFPHTTIQDRHRSYFKFLLEIFTSPEYHKAVMEEGQKMRTIDYDDLLRYTPFEIPELEDRRYAFMAEAKRRLDRKWKFTSTTPLPPSSEAQPTHTAAPVEASRRPAPPVGGKKQTPKSSQSSATTSTRSMKLEEQISSRSMLNQVYLEDKVINYFNKEITPHLEKYHQWLYEHEIEHQNNQSQKYNIACAIYDQLDYTKLFRYTPFPLYVEHEYEFIGLREAQRAIKAKAHPTTYKPGEPDPKPAMLDWFRFTIPPKYFEFYKWLFKLHLEKEEYGQIVQLSKKLGPPNYEQLLSSTPYPIPEAHLNFWAFIKLGFDEYVAQLKKATPPMSPKSVATPKPYVRRRRSIEYDSVEPQVNIRRRRSILETPDTFTYTLLGEIGRAHV